MKILAIETSCDDSCAAIIDTQNWKLLSDVVQNHIEPMKRYGGIVPELASREHVKALPYVVDHALKIAAIQFKDLDRITVTSRPGLMGSLLVGVSYAKSLAYSLGIPFSLMNHLEGHLFSPLLATLNNDYAPEFPWIALVVSGGHTELFKVHDFLEYQWIGGTLDDAAGEAFDKIGKILGLPYPAGPFIDRWCRESASENDRRAFSFPRAQVPDFQFSFSGLKTAVKLASQSVTPLTDTQILQIIASSQEAILDSLISQVEKAQKHFSISQVVITGGVACNSRLRERMPNAYFPKPSHCTDNAAMIALLSGLYAKHSELPSSPWDENPSPVATLYE